MRNYTRVQPTIYADYVDKGTAGDAAEAAHSSVPEIEPTDTLDDIEMAVAQLSEKPSKVSGATSESPRRSTSAKPTAANTTTVVCTRKRAAPVEPTYVDFDVGEGTAVRAALSDTWSLVGAHIQIPHTLWGITDDGVASCVVDGLIGQHVFPDGKSRVSYVVTELATGVHYPVSASYLATVVDRPLRNKLRKASTPKPR